MRLTKKRRESVRISNARLGSDEVLDNVSAFHCVPSYAIDQYPVEMQWRTTYLFSILDFWDVRKDMELYDERCSVFALGRSWMRRLVKFEASGLSQPQK